MAYDAILLERQRLLSIIHENLADKSKIVLDKKVAKVEHRSDGVVVECKDGSRFEGDVLVGADGVFSKVRQEMWRLAEEAKPGLISAEEKNGKSSGVGVSGSSHNDKTLRFRKPALWQSADQLRSQGRVQVPLRHLDAN